MATASTLTDEVLRDLECPVCQEQYKDPRMIPCGHTLCLKPCLEQIAGDKLHFKCPECRTQHDVPKDGLEAFPKNMVISRMLTVRPKVKHDKPKFSSCPICDEDDELRRCGHCQVYVCVGCLIEHTPQYKQILKDRALQILPQQEIASSDVKTSANDMLQSVNQQADKSISEIDTAASLAVALIGNKARELEAVVESARQEELKQVTEMSEERQSNLKSAVNYTKGILEELGNATVSPVKLDRINAQLSENEVALNYDLKSLVMQKSIDTYLNMSSLTTAIEKMVIMRRPVDQRQVHVDTDWGLSPSGDKTGNAIAHGSKLLETNLSQIKIVFDSANPNRVRPSCPRAVAIDPNNGDVVVTDTDNHRVERYDSTGKLILCFGTQGNGTSQFSNPGGLVINDQSQMFICDTGNHRIKIYNKDGSHCRDIGKQGSRVKEFSSPCDLTFDRRDNIHVCDSYNGRIQVLTQDGTYLCQYEPAGCTRPERICITSNENIGVTFGNKCIILNHTSNVYINGHYLI